MGKLTRIRDRFMKQRGRLSKDVRMQKACTRSEFREPCRKGQVLLILEGKSVRSHRCSSSLRLVGIIIKLLVNFNLLLALVACLSYISCRISEYSYSSILLSSYSIITVILAMEMHS